MKSSDYGTPSPLPDDGRSETVVRSVEILTVDDWNALSSSETDLGEDCDVPGDEEPKECVDLMSTFVSAEDISVQKIETCMRWKDSQASLASSEVSVQRETQEERWSDTQTSPPSSEFSVAKENTHADAWSDCRVLPPGRVEDAETVTFDVEPAIAQCEPMSDMYYTASSEVSLVSDTELPEKAQQDKDEGKECVIAGHVAAMRERFESMTRANTPCPDSMRSASPPLDVFRNITPSPDQLG